MTITPQPQCTLCGGTHKLSACPWRKGRYNLTQLADCVRLVRDSKPHQQRQEAMLAVIERTPGAPSRDEVLDGLKGE